MKGIIGLTYCPCCNEEYLVCCCKAPELSKVFVDKHGRLSEDSIVNDRQIRYIYNAIKETEEDVIFCFSTWKWKYGW